jgi:hypothetical protein
LRRDEFVDLVRFLSELGKEGDYKIKGENTLRRWKVLNYSPTLNEVMNKDGFRALGKENPGYAWSPAYSKVNGELPIAEVPKFQVFIHKMSAVQTEIEVTSGGQVGLKINDTTAMKCFLGETEVSLKNNEATFELPAGKHTLTLSWDHTLRTNAALLAELVEPAGTKARFKPVGGP